MTNLDVINFFVLCMSAESTTLKSTGEKLFSYDTCIAQHLLYLDMILVNPTKYSATTTKHQHLLMRGLQRLKCKVVLSEVPIGTKDLKHYISNTYLSVPPKEWEEEIITNVRYTKWNVYGKYGWETLQTPKPMGPAEALKYFRAQAIIAVPHNLK